VALPLNNLLLLGFYFSLLEDEVLACYTLPDVMDILDHGLEVRSRIVRASDKHVVGLSQGHRCVERADGHKSEDTMVRAAPIHKERAYFSWMEPRS
jgi:hypothetical protein